MSYVPSVSQARIRGRGLRRKAAHRWQSRRRLLFHDVRPCYRGVWRWVLAARRKHRGKARRGPLAGSSIWMGRSNAKRAHVRERRREKLAAMADRVDHRVNLQPSLQRQEQRAQERAEAEVRPDDERERRREQTRARAKRKELYRRPARKSAPTR